MSVRRQGGGGPVMATKRIKKEIADLSKENLGNITLTPNESNIFVWKATLPGPAGSPYEGGVFDVDIRIPEDYPFSPPRLQFLTKVYHCNINSSGGICLDLLKNAWSPALSLYKVILSLSSLLTDPNPADPLVPPIANELRRNKKQHDATAREWVKLYATPKTAPPPPPAPVPEPTSSRTTASATRRTPIVRPVPNGSSTAAAPIAGTRRTHSQANGTNGSSRPIDVVDDDGPVEVADSSDVEVVDGASRATNGTSSKRGTRSTKRQRMDGSSSSARAGGSSTNDDVIVIDD